jgi:hypothetical protein
MKFKSLFAFVLGFQSYIALAYDKDADEFSKRCAQFDELSNAGKSSSDQCPLEGHLLNMVRLYSDFCKNAVRDWNNKDQLTKSMGHLQTLLNKVNEYGGYSNCQGLAKQIRDIAGGSINTDINKPTFNPSLEELLSNHLKTFDHRGQPTTDPKDAPKYFPRSVSDKFS